MRVTAWVLGCLLLLGAQSPSATGQAGDRQGTIRHGGLVRTYLLHVPPAARMSRPVPLVLVFHGGFGTGQGMVALTGFNDLADRQGFLVAYPDGIDRHWSDGGGRRPPNGRRSMMSGSSRR